MKKILVIDYCNYIDYQIGGHLSFAKNLISAFGQELTLVGITTEIDEPVGKWFKKAINGIEYDYFALARYNKGKTKHMIPDRLACFLMLKFYRKEIKKKDFKNVFVQRQEIIPALKSYNYQNICYLFPGLESPLMISKYWYGKFLAEWFDKVFFSSLIKVKLILANGDDDAIAEMVGRTRGLIKLNSVIKFPIRINTDVFRPLNKTEMRKQLNLPESEIIVTTSGRLSWLKGWKFMIDCFLSFQKRVPNSLFYIIGEGEEKEKIKDYLDENNISHRVFLTGGKKPDQLSLFLNASDLFIMGSYKEGWSTTLSEAISCGIPSCVTNFSSAKEIISEGLNGFVIDDRNEGLFVERMQDAIKIKRPVYNDHVRAFSTNKLKEDLLGMWQLY